MKTVTFKDFVGLQISGTIPIGACDSPYHLDKSEWITAQVESAGKFGTIISYDGTGITAGLHQYIAVYPRELNSQGPLWRLLNRIRQVCGDEGEWKAVNNMITEAGWVLGSEGVLRYREDGKLVLGGAIRDRLTGNADGKMPLSGPGYDRAVAWAQAFHELFVLTATHKTQRDVGLEHFLQMNDHTSLQHSKKGKKLTIQQAVYGDKHFSTLTDGDISVELEIAMSMYWSNSVNAPGAAVTRLCKVFDKVGVIDGGKPQGVPFARELITALGNTTFGRWDDDIPGGRYQRTRKAAMSIWPESYFVGPEAIMPADLPG